MHCLEPELSDWATFRFLEVKTDELLVIFNIMDFPLSLNCTSICAVDAEVFLKSFLSTFVKDLDAEIGLLVDTSTGVDFNSNFANRKFHIKGLHLAILFHLISVELAAKDATNNTANFGKL